MNDHTYYHPHGVYVVPKEVYQADAAELAAARSVIDGLHARVADAEYATRFVTKDLNKADEELKRFRAGEDKTYRVAQASIARLRDRNQQIGSQLGFYKQTTTHLRREVSLLAAQLEGLRSCLREFKASEAHWKETALEHWDDLERHKKDNKLKASMNGRLYDELLKAQASRELADQKHRQLANDYATLVEEQADTREQATRWKRKYHHLAVDLLRADLEGAFAGIDETVEEQSGGVSEVLSDIEPTVEEQDKLVGNSADEFIFDELDVPPTSEEFERLRAWVGSVFTDRPVATTWTAQATPEPGYEYAKGVRAHDDMAGALNFFFAAGGGFPQPKVTVTFDDDAHEKEED